MGDRLYAKRTAADQVQEPAKAASQRKPSPVDPTRIPLWATLAYGNQVPPSLRLPVAQPPHVERAKQESGSPAENDTGERLQRGSQAASQEEETRQEGAEPRQHKQNTTGLPETLKVGIESLSGISLDDVHVHYNSPEPARLQALAYTKGSEIHVGPGQEQHLAHEAWHAVQQKQGRVKPTLQEGVAINNEKSLEKEADVMGVKVRVLPFHGLQKVQERRDAPLEQYDSGQAVVEGPIQRVYRSPVDRNGIPSEEPLDAVKVWLAGGGPKNDKYEVGGRRNVPVVPGSSIEGDVDYTFKWPDAIVYYNRARNVRANVHYRALLRRRAGYTRPNYVLGGIWMEGVTGFSQPLDTLDPGLLADIHELVSEIESIDLIPAGNQNF